MPVLLIPGLMLPQETVNEGVAVNGLANFSTQSILSRNDSQVVPAGTVPPVNTSLTALSQAPPSIIISFDVIAASSVTPVTVSSFFSLTLRKLSSATFTLTV